MKVTIDIDDDLLKRARVRAHDERTTLRRIVEVALREYLAPPPRRRSYRLQWRTERGRVLPGVDLDSRASLYRRMDGQD